MISATPDEVRRDLVARREIALIDLRSEAEFATGHPLFAAQIPVERLVIEAPGRVPRRTTKLVLYDNGEGLVTGAAAVLREIGYSDVRELRGGLRGWSTAGYELFEDVNSYCKAFGELVEARRDTPSLPAAQVKQLLDQDDDVVVLDVRRFDEYQTMSVPSAMSVPGAEIVMQARSLAPDPKTRIVVNCAGRTRGLIAAQSLINAGLPNPVAALRNGTIGWLLAGQKLDHGRSRCAPAVGIEQAGEARMRAEDVAYRSGVKRLSRADMGHLQAETSRTVYRFDVRLPEQFALRPRAEFRNAPGGQLVQETDMFAPVRGARIVLADDLGAQASMTASWLAQMGWEVFVLDDPLETPPSGGAVAVEPPPRSRSGRYRRPYEGVDSTVSAMQAYLDWEAGLVDQLARDGTHGFFVI